MNDFMRKISADRSVANHILTGMIITICGLDVLKWFIIIEKKKCNVII